MYIKKKLVLILALIALLSLFVSVALSAQDTVRIKHTNYTTVFSKSKRYPVLVEWYVTRAKIGCPTPLVRKDAFQPDPQLIQETDIKADYVGSGLDRGHNMPAAENLCQGADVQTESFYMSNMTPQYHSLNAGDWKTLEVLERATALERDSVHVWAGSVGVAKKIGRVSVPKQCWKVIYTVKDKQYLAFIFNNTPDKPKGLYTHQVPVQAVEKLTGFRFK
jgi:endonuclease G